MTEPGVGTNRYAYSFNDPGNLMDPGGKPTILARTMKDQTKILLDGATELLQIQGFRRKKRGMLVRSRLEGMIEIVSLQPTEYPDGMVEILVHFAVAWDELETLYATSFGLQYNLGRWATLSVLGFTKPPFFFEPAVAPDGTLDRLREFVGSECDGRFPLPTSPLEVARELAALARDGGGSSEKVVLAVWLLEGRARAAHKLTEFMQRLNNPLHRERLEVVAKRLQLALD